MPRKKRTKKSLLKTRRKKEDEEVKAEDEKWEAIYEEIAEIKAMIKGLKNEVPEDANVELSKNTYSSIMMLKKQGKGIMY